MGKCMKQSRQRVLGQNKNCAHASAEPGLLFWDTMTDYHNAEYCSPLVSTNPCAEQPLPDGGCCNSGQLTSSVLLMKTKISWLKSSKKLLK